MVSLSPKGISYGLEPPFDKFRAIGKYKQTFVYVLNINNALLKNNPSANLHYRTNFGMISPLNHLCCFINIVIEILREGEVAMSKSSTLTQKLALVTGAGSGIGRATAILLGQLGARVIICDRNPS